MLKTWASLRVCHESYIIKIDNWKDRISSEVWKPYSSKFKSNTLPKYFYTQLFVVIYCIIKVIENKYTYTIILAVRQKMFLLKLNSNLRPCLWDMIVMILHMHLADPNYLCPLHVPITSLWFFFSEIFL